MKKILVAHRDEAFIKQLKAVLLPLEYEIKLVELDQFIADADHTDNALIILDPKLGNTGIASGLIDTLKSRVATSRIPILLCSTQENNVDIINGLSAGASDFIILPATTRSISKRIKALLNK